MSPEDILKSKAVGIAYIQFCIRHRGSGGKVEFIRSTAQFISESNNIIYRLSGTNSTLSDIVGVIVALLDIIQMFLTEIVSDGLDRHTNYTIVQDLFPCAVPVNQSQDI